MYIPACIFDSADGRNNRPEFDDDALVFSLPTGGLLGSFCSGRGCRIQCQNNNHLDVLCQNRKHKAVLEKNCSQYCIMFKLRQCALVWSIEYSWKGSQITQRTRIGRPYQKNICRTLIPYSSSNCNDRNSVGHFTSGFLCLIITLMWQFCKSHVSCLPRRRIIAMFPRRLQQNTPQTILIFLLQPTIPPSHPKVH
jgi:hypothetical protein